MSFTNSQYINWIDRCAAALAAAGVAIAVARRRRKAVTAGAEHASDDAQ